MSFRRITNTRAAVTCQIELDAWRREDEARAAFDHLAAWFARLPPVAAQAVHMALLMEAADEGMTGAARDAHHAEGEAFRAAFPDPYLRPTQGHTIRLCPELPNREETAA